MCDWQEVKKKNVLVSEPCRKNRFQTFFNLEGYAYTKRSNVKFGTV